MLINTIPEDSFYPLTTVLVQGVCHTGEFSLARALLRHFPRKHGVVDIAQPM
jgi:hypothetical protein